MTDNENDPMRIETLTAHRWACTLCGDAGPLEITEQYAEEGYQSHSCTDSRPGG